MIRWTLAALLAMAAGVLLAQLLLQDNGYVLIGFGVYTVEGSLSLFLLLDLVLFVGLYLGIRSLIRIWGMPEQVRDWNHRRLIRRSRRDLTRGLLQMAEGQWRAAEKRLVRHAENAETPLLNYLAAARAAQLQGEHERRDRYLHLAHESMPSADVAVGLTQAELQLAHHQLEQSLATLTHLRSIAPKHMYVLKLLRELYIQLGDWRKLSELLPELKRRKVGTPEELLKLERRVQLALLEQAARGGKLAELELAWRQIPRTRRQDPALVAAQAGHLMELGAEDRAEPLLHEAVRRQWNDELVRLYGELDSGQPGNQLTRAEAWLQQHPGNAVLLLALGRLSLRAKLWGKARSYLEASLGTGHSADAYQELGNLLEQLGEKEAAMSCYRKGLAEGASQPPVALPRDIAPHPRSGDSQPLPSPTDTRPPSDPARLGDIPSADTKLADSR